MRLQFDWSEEQALALSVTTGVSGFLSVVGALFIICGRRVDSSKPGAVHDSMVFVLALINLPLAVCFGLGPIPHDVIKSKALCTAQGFSLQVLGMMSVVWTCCLGHSLFVWIVLKRHIQALMSYRKWYFFLTTTISLALAVVLLAFDAFAPSGVWCWVADTKYQLPFFWIEVLVSWLFNMFVFIAIHRETHKRLAKEHRVAPLSSVHVATPLVSARTAQVRAIARRLSLYMLVFVLEWCFGLINRVVNLVSGVNFTLTLLHCMFVPLQGWLNAVVYGSLHSETFQTLGDCLCCCCCCAGDDEESSPVLLNTCICAESTLPPHQHSKGISHTTNLAPTIPRTTSATATPSRATAPSTSSSTRSIPITRSTQRRGTMHSSLKDVSIHVVTWNMGECKVPSNISHILYPKNTTNTTNTHSNPFPPSDLIVVGVQECMHLDQVKSCLANSLGASYVMFSAEIGNTNRFLGFHGFIGLICFVRQTLLEDGVVEPMETATDSGLKRGLNLGVLRAPNKGAVALGFRVFGSQITFITAHLAADKGGVSGLEKRNRDIQAIFRELIVDYDDTGSDLQLCRHHTILLGDLNYRLDCESTETALNLISQAYAHHSPNFSQPQNEIASKAVENAARARLTGLDQLSTARDKNTVFHGWHEMQIRFPPTYRLVKNVPHRNYESIADLKQLYSAKRVPSYTDRILIHSLQDVKNSLRCVAYSSVPTVITSDHTPVYAAMNLQRDQNAEFFMQSPDAEIQYHAVTISLANLNVAFIVDHLRNQNVESVKLVFPLPHEDPYFEQRKIQALSSAIAVDPHMSPPPSTKFGVEQTFVVGHRSLNACKFHVTASTPVLLPKLHVLVEVQPGAVQCVFPVNCNFRSSSSVSSGLVNGGKLMATIAATLEVAIL